MSPIEANSINLQNTEDIYQLFNKIKTLAQVSLIKEKKYQKDAAFLYWTLRIYWKLEVILPPDTTFLAINNLIPFLIGEHAIKAVQILKKIFEKGNYIKFIDLCHPLLKQLFQYYALELTRDRLKSIILTEKYKEIKKKNDTSKDMFEIYDSNEIYEIINICKTCVGEATIKKEKTEKWIDLDQSNFSNSELIISKTIQDIIRYLWYIRIQEQLEKNNNIEWRIRLLSLLEAQDKNKILEMVLAEDLKFTSESGNVITLYLRNSLFPIEFQGRFQRWKERVEKTSQSTHILHSLDQPAYFNPWIFDNDFLNFAEKILDFSIERSYNSDPIIKAWNSSIKSLRKQYKVSGLINFSNGTYSEMKENEEFDIGLFTNIFNESIIKLYIEEKKTEDLYITPIIPQKNRISLEYLNDQIPAVKIFSVQLQISCKKLVSTLKNPIKRIYFLLKPLKKNVTQQVSKSKDLAKDSFQFFTLKKNKKLDSHPKALPWRFINILENQQKQTKHRRIQSVVLAPSTIQKPFQLIRVQKSYA